MALDFPSPVSSGAIYTGTNGVTYYYDGIKWQGEQIFSWNGNATPILKFSV